MPLQENPDEHATIEIPIVSASVPHPSQSMRKKFLQNFLTLGIFAATASLHPPAPQGGTTREYGQETSPATAQFTKLNALPKGTSLFGRPLRLDVQGKPVYLHIEQTHCAFLIRTDGAAYEVTELTIDDIAIPCSPQLLHSTGGKVTMERGDSGVHATCMTLFGMMEIHVDVEEQDVIRALQEINASQQHPEFAQIAVHICKVYGTVEKPNGGECVVSLKKQKGRVLAQRSVDSTPNRTYTLPR